MSSPHDHKPAQEEPRTPGWLTALGISLFVLAGLGWLFTRPDQPTIDQMRAAAPQASQSANQPPAAAPGASAAPSPSGADPRGRL